MFRKKTIKMECLDLEIQVVEGGTVPPTPQLACFVLYLKVINTLENSNTMCIF